MPTVLAARPIRWILGLTVVAGLSGLAAGAPDGGRDTHWSEFAQNLCESKGEGIYFERYPNGEIKASIVCDEHDDEVYVKQARYFDRHGRGVANEQNNPEDPSKSRYLEWVYDEETGPPTETLTWDGRGQLLERKPWIAEKKAVAVSTEPWHRGTYNDYLEICRTTPEAALAWRSTPRHGRQFFEDAACPCLAEKAVRVDEERDPAFLRAHHLDPGSLADRLTVAAARNLTECLCPNAVPGTSLESDCAGAAEVERAWRRPD